MTTSTDAEAWEGRAASLAVWVLYLLSIPSATVFAIVGVVVAYTQRASAGPLARAHFDEQIRLFWIMFVWAAALLVGTIIAGILTIVLIGFPILWLIGIVGFVIMVWFTVKSVFGLARLLDDRGP